MKIGRRHADTGRRTRPIQRFASTAYAELRLIAPNYAESVWGGCLAGFRTIPSPPTAGPIRKRRNASTEGRLITPQSNMRLTLPAFTRSCAGIAFGIRLANDVEYKNHSRAAASKPVHALQDLPGGWAAHCRATSGFRRAWW